MSSDLPPSAGEPPGPPALLGYASGLRPAHCADVGPNVMRDGTMLIALDGVTLPPRCVLCGRDGWRNPVRLSFSWDTSFHLTAQSSLQLRSKARIHAYLCAFHRARWLRGRIGGTMGMAAGIAAMLAGITLAAISENSDIPRYTSLGIAITILGFATVICFLFFFTLSTRTLSCRSIQEGYVYLEGAAQEFLTGLPPLPARPQPPEASSLARGRASAGPPAS